MTKIMNNVVRKVVQEGLCSGCGVCAGICPINALSMEIKENGDLAPSFDATCCSDNCHLCLDICPFGEGVYNPRRMNTEIYGGQPNVKFIETIGWHICSIVGFRKGEGLRRASASGGLATWCLEKLLKKGVVTRVAVVRFAKQHEKGFFEFFSASTIDEIRQSSGSVYHPVEISEIIKAIEIGEKERWGIIGVPCLCAAIRNIDSLREKILYIFGLTCGMYQNTFYTELLLAKSGVDQKHVIDIKYRRKSNDGPAYDFRFCGVDNNGCGREIPYYGLSYFLGKNAYFRLNACNYCMDVFAETADACFMDAWLPGYSFDSRGTSLVVIRNEEIYRMLQQGLTEGEICVNNIDTEEVSASQQDHVKRKRELIYMRRGLRGPKGSVRKIKPAVMEKIAWFLQLYTQGKSKKSWAKYGRRYGRWVFWLAMSGTLLIQVIVSAAGKAARLPGRLFKKYGIGAYQVKDGGGE